MEDRETYENRSLPGPVAARSRQIQGLIQEGGRLADLVKREVSAGKVEQRFQLLWSISELPPQVRRFLIISGGFVKAFQEFSGRAVSAPRPSGLRRGRGRHLPAWS